MPLIRHSRQKAKVGDCMNRQNVFTKLQVCLFIHFNELLKDCKVDVEHKEISVVRQRAKLYNKNAPNYTTKTRQIIQRCG